STLPDRFVSKQGYLALQKYFPGASADPVRIVVANDAADAKVRSALSQLKTHLAVNPKFGPGQLRFADNGEVAALDVPIRGDDAGDASLTAVRKLRSTTIPRLFGGTDARVLVGGRTAENIDYADSVT